MGRRFDTRRDMWLMAIIYGSVLICAITAWPAIVYHHLHWSGLLVAVICLVTIILLLWVALGTYYEIDDGVLKINHGPYRWRIPLEQIESITPIRSYRSSPALSMNRVMISYAGGKTVMVSPERQQEFIMSVSA